MRGSFAYRRRPRLPAPTARLRLTLLYTGMLLILGAAAFGLTYALTSRTATIAVASPAVTPTPSPGSSASAVVSRRRSLTPAGPKDVVVQQHSADQRRLLAVSLLVLALS